MDWNLISFGCIRCPTVTPFVGVWIETGIGKSVASDLKVTPFVGVWIETKLICTFATGMRVTPFVGVWIETLNHQKFLHQRRSHPSWVCGLKQNATAIEKEQYKSHPSWVCGLKQENSNHAEKSRKVTPFVGVWIETKSCPSYTCWPSRHTLRGCVDWNSSAVMCIAAAIGHTLRGCVDWNNMVCRWC